MSEQEDDVLIIELDGPPQAYFEIPVLCQDCPVQGHQPHELAFMLRIHFRSLRVLEATEAMAAAGLKQLIAQVRTELEMVARQAGLDQGILWWRRHPTGRNSEDGRVSYLARVATSPDLSAEFWKRVATEDGLVPKPVEVAA